jgi:hypothetical protein
MKKSDTKIYRFATFYHIVEEIENYERVGGPNCEYGIHIWIKFRRAINAFSSAYFGGGCFKECNFTTKNNIAPDGIKRE